MKKIKVGIIGYGNLGKSVEKLISQNSEYKLVAIFSKRNVKAMHAPVEFVSNLEKYKNKIDVMFLCGGSSSNLMEQAQDALQYFNCIDAFDTHKKIPEHLNACNVIAQKNQKVAFCSFGWDPGLFSLMRVLFNALNYTTYTTWGKGVSQGHSEALRCVKDVKDAIQYTIPNIKLVNKLKSGDISKLDNEKDLHLRQCFVVTDQKNKKEIESKIINMPNYFKGYKTIIKFITPVQMLKHNKMFHAGEVFTVGGDLSFKLKIDSNPNFTARVMILYSKVLFNYYINEKFGAYSILDVPFGDLINNSVHFL